MQGKNDSLRFTIQFSRNDPRHIQAAKVLNLKGLRSKASYLTEAILHYESCGAAHETSDVELTSLVESIVLSILAQEHRLRHELHPAVEEPEAKVTKSASESTVFDSDIMEKAKRELGESGIKSISSALSRLRQK